MTMNTLPRPLRLLIAPVLLLLAPHAPGSELRSGDLAPAFQLRDQNNQVHELSDYEGQWLVLYFYPNADTPGCTTEACAFR